MKRIVFLICIGNLALALTALGARKSASAHGSARASGAPKAHAISERGGAHVASRSAPMRTGFSKAPSHQRAVTSTSRSSRIEAARARSARIVNVRTEAIARSRAAISRERNLARATALRTGHNEAARTRNERIAGATRAAARRNLVVNRQRNLTLARNVLANRAGNVRIVNNWRSARFNNPRYAGFYNYRRGWHDRDWWHHHFTRVVFVFGGWWAWWDGYWYPAWGYDPYAWYPYDGPIYTGYADLTPNRVIVNVQVALRDQGYYAGSTDGVMGPQTRAALAAFQSDHGLEITSTVDQPTLQTMGLS
jgi:Putative peptidoglycan binding domain